MAKCITFRKPIANVDQLADPKRSWAAVRSDTLLTALQYNVNCLFKEKAALVAELQGQACTSLTMIQ